MLKGVQSREDAELALEYGLDGVIISNVSSTFCAIWVSSS